MSISEARLRKIREIVENTSSAFAMSNRDEPDWCEEIRAVLDGTMCPECDAYPRFYWPTRSMKTRHYTHCSKFKKEEWR